MKRGRFKAAVLVALVGCASVAVVEVTEIAITDGQGSDLQGSDLQGSDLQGTNLNGTRYDGAAWEWTSLDNITRTSPLTIVNGSIEGGTLTWWAPVAGTNRWERHRPDSTCIFNQSRTQLISCHTVDLTQTASPLAGTRFTARFRNGATTFDTTIQIGLSTTDKDAVRRNTSVAMFGLDGHDTTCAVKPCSNPAGCRENCDLWLYRVYIVDSTVNNGQPHAACGNDLAYAVPGIYATDGTRTTDNRKFTFSCEKGTIAKCTRWGFRSWGSARKKCQSDCTSNNTTLYPLADLHQSCVRAAMADYCAHGDSYTRAGTVVDVWDYQHTKPNAWGFVPRTDTTPEVGAFRYESTFDKYSAYRLDHKRYDELHENPYEGHQLSPACEASMLPFCDANGENCDGYKRSAGPDDPSSFLHIASMTACAHAELSEGKWLDANCSICTQQLASLSAYAHCFDPTTPHSWDAACVQGAQTLCTSKTHSECTTGPRIGSDATGCANTVCRDNPSCCSPLGSWTAACVTYANDHCYGGIDNPATQLGFCGTPRTPPANQQ